VWTIHPSSPNKKQVTKPQIPCPSNNSINDGSGQPWTIPPAA
jgi:hypothetical protein